MMRPVRQRQKEEAAMRMRERWAERLARLSLRAAVTVSAVFFIVLAFLSGLASLAWWLRTFWPGWAVWLALSGVFLLFALIGLAWSRSGGHESTKLRTSSPGAGESDQSDVLSAAALAGGDPRLMIALTVGESLGEAARKRPKAALALALGVGVALGASPTLRRDLMALAGLAGSTPSQKRDAKAGQDPASS
ncbi:MAG: hypothetical protein D6757_07050 [Alphaproteobacteria bacterium]|nr:MAG: hypothetical protein D6757_07050 [Alphaproteobacteria bacterium]